MRATIGAFRTRVGIRPHEPPRQHVVAQNAPEDVDQHLLHVGVRQQDAHRRANAFLVCAAAHVEEVGGRRAHRRHDVHRRHGQPRAVDQAPHVAVQPNVDDSYVVRPRLQRVLLAYVPQSRQVLVAEHGVVVYGQLGVHRQHAAVARDRQGIDFHLRAVEVIHELVELHNEVRRWPDEFGWHTHAVGELPSLPWLQPDGGVDDSAKDLLRRLSRYFLDLHPARRARDYHRAPLARVEHDCRVELLCDVHGLFDQHGVDGDTLRPGLEGDELRPKDGRGELRRCLRAVDDPNAARLAAAPCVHLRLHDHPAAQLLGDLPRLFRRGRHAAARHGDAVLGHKLLGLILVDLHPGSFTKRRPVYPRVIRARGVM